MTTLADRFKITDAERDQRMAFLHLGRDDFQLLAGLRPLITPHIPAVVDAFYVELLRHSEPRRFFINPKTLERVKAGQRAYLAVLFAGEPDDAYIEQRLMIGEVHERIGVPLKWYIGAMGFFLHRLADALQSEPSLDAGRRLAAVLALTKVMNLDLQLAMESYASLSLRMKTLDQRIRETADALNSVLDKNGESHA